MKDFFNKFTALPIDITSYNLCDSGYSKNFPREYWPLYSDNESEKHIFMRHCNGVKLSPTSLFVHTNQAVLQRRCKEIGDTDKNFEDIINRWYNGQQKKPNKNKLTIPIRIQIGKEVQKHQQFKKSIRPYSFRPFLNSFVFYSEKVLKSVSSAGGGGTRSRPELHSAYSVKSTIGLSIAPARKDIGGELHRFTTFCWHLPDNDLCARGNANILCNSFPSYKNKKQQNWDSIPKSNINPVLLDTGICDKDWIFYVYAILCSDWYIQNHDQELFTVSGTQFIPRIPIPQSVKSIRCIAKYGSDLANAEKEEWTTPEIEAKTNTLSYLYKVEFKLCKIKICDNVLELYDEQSKSPIISIDQFDKEIANKKISGYQVVKTWLKFHSYSYTRTSFSKCEFNSLIRLLCKLEYQRKINLDLSSCLEFVFTKNASLM